jgi:hypothetical protein
MDDILHRLSEVALSTQSGSTYRCYLLNSDNSFRNAQEFPGVDDDEARQRAVAWLDLPENSGAQGLELWRRDERILTRRRGLFMARAATD